MRTKKTAVLAAALAVLALSWSLLIATRTMIPTGDYADKLEAAQRTQACMEEIRRLKEELGVPINSASDINDTGMIGQDYSLITTTLGNLWTKTWSRPSCQNPAGTVSASDAAAEQRRAASVAIRQRARRSMAIAVPPCARSR